MIIKNYLFERDMLKYLLNTCCDSSIHIEKIAPASHQNKD